MDEQKRLALLEELEFDDAPTEETQIEINGEWRNHVYYIVSKVAYLLGVPKKIFESENQPPKIEIFEELQKNKNARIVRNLCIIRTQIERNFSKINSEMTYGLKGIANMPELVSCESIEELRKDGIDVVKANQRPGQYIVDLNIHINNRINNCRDIFPLWLNWNYVRDIFIMPNGTKEEGAKNSASKYYANMQKCPYQVYINWPDLESGNIILNDKKFVTALYANNHDYFKDLAKVTDASIKTRSGVFNFIEGGNREIIIVDCENADPFKFYAMLKNLSDESLLGKIAKIILYDDVNTTTAWDIINEFTELEVEHIVLDRVINGKSYLDIQLSARATKEHYKNGIDSFILVSSDSDYWGLMSEVSDARFLVMIEQKNCSPAFKATLVEHGITYCMIDEFCTGSSYEIKEGAVLSELRRLLDENCNFNVNDIVDAAFTATRADMTQNEYKQFRKKYITPMHLSVDHEGNVTIELGE